jgi:hypothetical protein
MGGWIFPLPLMSTNAHKNRLMNPLSDFFGGKAEWNRLVI